MKTLVLAAVLAGMAPAAAWAQDDTVVSTAAPSTTAPPPGWVTAAPTTTAAAGLSPAAVTAWLATQGVTPGAVEQDEANYYTRVTDGPLTWVLFFQSCDNGVCGDLQFSIGFATAAVTPEIINGWNRDRRFLKAFHEAGAGGEPATGIVQYDVFTRPGEGPEQLADHLAVWRGLAPEFARLVTRTAAAPEPEASAN